MKKFILAGLCLLASMIVLAQGEYEHHIFTHKGDTLKYRLLLPDSYNPEQAYPVVYFLHGSGERGNDNEAQLVHGSKLFLDPENRKKYPAFVIFPQCPANDSWTTMLKDHRIARSFSKSKRPTKTMTLLLGLIKNFEKAHPIIQEQVYIGGLSMGGMGVFEIAGRKPRFFAAAFPICGGGDASKAERMHKINWWVFHGAEDKVVPPAYSADMVTALQRAGAEVRFSLYPDTNHNSWDKAFAEPELLPWLFSQKKK